MAKASSPNAQGGGPDGIATRKRIVEAASAMFFERGFDGVPMSQVAEASGVSTPALYWHFKSKQDLYLEVLEAVYLGFFDELAENTVGETASQRLHSYVRWFIELQLRDRDAVMMFGIGQLGARLSEDKQAEFTALQEPYRALLGRILEEGHESGEFQIEDISVVALAIHTMCEYSAVWFMPDKRLTSMEVAEIHANLAVRMTASRLPSTSTADR